MNIYVVICCISVSIAITHYMSIIYHPKASASIGVIFLPMAILDVRYIIHLMCSPEGNSEFCFPEGKQNSLFPEGVHIKCFVIYQGKKNHFYDNCISRYDNKSKFFSVNETFASPKWSELT